MNSRQNSKQSGDNKESYHLLLTNNNDKTGTYLITGTFSSLKLKNIDCQQNFIQIYQQNETIININL